MKKTEKKSKFESVQLNVLVSKQTKERLGILAKRLCTKPNKAVELAILYALDAQEKDMTDSDRIKEIHAAVNEIKLFVQ